MQLKLLATAITLQGCLQNVLPTALLNVTDNPSAHDQCSVWHYLSNGSVLLSAENCSRKYGYYCNSKASKAEISFHEYNGWTFVLALLPEVTKLFKWQGNGTIQSCKDQCRRWTYCVAFSYWHNSTKCDFIVINNNLDIVYVTYTIQDDASMGQNVTHGHKGPYNVTLHEKSAVQTTDTFQQAFPTCNITGATNLTTTSVNPPITTESTPFMTSSVKVSNASISSIIPENCVCLQKCTFTNLTELEEVIERIIRNLTISKKVTSKYKRKFVSADDSRQSAQVMGTVAIVFIAFVSLGIVFLDYGIVFFKVLVRIKVIVLIGNNGTVDKITRIHVQQEQATTSTV